MATLSYYDFPYMGERIEDDITSTTITFTWRFVVKVESNPFDNYYYNT